MSTFTRNVPMSEDRMREAMDKQAKQKALREGLDSQMMARGPETPGATKGLSKAQQKFQELQKLREDANHAGRQHQTMSLPPNFNMSDTNPTMSSRLAPRPQGDVGVVHQAGSLPANFNLSFIPSPARLPPPSPPAYNPAPPEPSRVDHRGPEVLPPRMVFDHKDLMNFVTKATDEPTGGGPSVETDTDDTGMPIGVARARAHIQKGKEVKQRREEKPSDPPPRSAATPQARRPPGTTALGEKHMQVKMDRLQKELEEREAKVHKLMEKEKNWEQQMRDLKVQLKRQKAPKGPTNGSTRAETAPVSLPELPGAKKKLEPLARPSNVDAGAARPQGPQAQGPNGVKAAHNRRDFNSTKRYAEGAFRPITAPNALEPLSAEARSSANSLPPLTKSSLLTNTLVRGSTEGESIYNVIKKTAQEINRNQPPPKDGTKFSYNQKAFNLDDVVVGEEEQVEEDIEEENVEMLDSQRPLAFHSKHGNSTMLRNELPVCLTEGRLEYFSTNQIITWQQKERLWDFFLDLGRQRLQSRSTSHCTTALECEEDFVGYTPSLAVLSPPHDLLETAPPNPINRRPSPPTSKLYQPSGRGRKVDTPKSEDSEGWEDAEEEEGGDGDEEEEGEEYEENEEEEMYDDEDAY